MPALCCLKCTGSSCKTLPHMYITTDKLLSDHLLNNTLYKSPRMQNKSWHVSYGMQRSIDRSEDEFL